MAVSDGPNIGLMINALLGDTFDVEFRRFLRAVDALLEGAVISRTLAAPPGSPANGDRYIVAASPTGAWAGQAYSIAVWTTDDPATPGGYWEFHAPKAGWLVYNVADTTVYVYSGSAWGALSGGGGASVFVASGSGHAQGLVPDPGATAGATKFLREDATFAVPGGASVFVASGSGHAQGLVPDPGATAGATKFLREDATFAVPAGGGGGGAAAVPAHLRRRTSYHVAGASNTQSPSSNEVGWQSLGDLLVLQSGSAWSGIDPPTAAIGGGILYSGGSPTFITGLKLYRTGRNIGYFAAVYTNTTSSQRMWVGLSDTLTSAFGNADLPAHNFAAFRFSDAAGDANFQCVVGNGSATTVLDSGVLIDTNEHRFAIEFVDATPAVLFYIDGVLVGTITTNLPSASTLLASYVSASGGRIGIATIEISSDL